MWAKLDMRMLQRRALNCPFLVRCHFTKLGLKQEAKKTLGEGDILAVPTGAEKKAKNQEGEVLCHVIKNF